MDEASDLCVGVKQPNLNTTQVPDGEKDIDHFSYLIEKNISHIQKLFK